MPARYGGFETLAQNLVLRLNSKFQFIVYCSKKLYDKKERQEKNDHAELIYLPVNSNGPQSIIYDIISIIHAAGKADILLLLGISGSIILPFIRLFSPKKIITHIDGLEWKRSKWNNIARLFLKISEFFAVRYSHSIIADNEAIKDYIIEKYNITPAFIEYGGDQEYLPSEIYDKNNDILSIKGNYALTVARIEPENNIHVILKAFSKIASGNIIIAGDWEKSRYGRKLYESYSHYPNIYLYKPLYNTYLLNLLRFNCEFYIHGHSAGGTNPALVEAMYAGCPVITYDVAYNRATTSGKALYFSNSYSLTDIIMNTDKLIFDRIGKHMKEIADKRYRWKMISEKYAGLFL